MSKAHKPAGSFYTLPALLLVAGVIYGGVGYTALVSLHAWSGIGPLERFVGFDNYAEMLDDPTFWTSMMNVLIFTVITVFLQMAIGLAMAIALMDGRVAGRSLYKVVLFLPVVLSPAVVSTAFRDILSSDGALNGLLIAVGLEQLSSPWLADPASALVSISLVNVWQWSGFSFILYQAAISQIDSSVFEAAEIDGATYLQRARLVLVPQLSNTHLTLIIVGAIGALKTFDLVYLTTGGGPGRSTEVLTTYIYEQAVTRFDAGYSAALSIMLLVLSLVFTITQARIGRRDNR